MSEISKKFQVGIGRVLVAVLLANMVIGILIKTKAVYAYDEEQTASWMDRVTNLCVTGLMLMGILAPVKMIHVGLGRGNKEQQEWMTEEFTWISHHSIPFGKLPAWLRSPYVLVVLGLEQVAAFLLQVAVCVLSFLTTQLASSYPMFLPLVIGSAICGLTSIFTIHLLNWYHSRLLRHVLLNSSSSVATYA